MEPLYLRAFHATLAALLVAAATLCPFRWQTKYFDNETGLYYFGYRFFDSLTGRWLSRDPLAENGGVNLYAFCNNDPVNGVDGLGLFDLPTHANVTISALRQMKRKMGLTDEQYSELLRGAVEGSMYPDLQVRPVIPKGTPLATIQDIDKVMCIIGYPAKKMKEAGKWINSKVDDAQAWAVGLVWKDYPRIRAGLKNWWLHGPSFIGPIFKAGADLNVSHMNALYQTHFGELSWQHGMHCYGMEVVEIQKKIIAGSRANLAVYEECVCAGNYYDAGFALGMALHYLQDTYTQSHTERDSDTGKIVGFYNYNAQSPTLHSVADAPSFNSSVFRTAVRQSKLLVEIFKNGDSNAIAGLFEVSLSNDAFTLGGRFAPSGDLINPFDLKGRFCHE